MNVADNLLISFLSYGEASAFLLLLLGSTVRFSVFDAIKLKQLCLQENSWAKLFKGWLAVTRGRISRPVSFSFVKIFYFLDNFLYSF